MESFAVCKRLSLETAIVAEYRNRNLTKSSSLLLDDEQAPSSSFLL